MNKLRKALVLSVMLMTVFSMSVVAAPEASAAAQAGDLIKMDGLSSVYYLDANGDRNVFPNEATFFSWYSDFSGVVTIPQSELESYPLKSNVTIRPGTKLVTSPSNSMVYAVEPGGVLRSIVSEENAINLYGVDWATRVVDVIDSFFTNYTVGDPLTEGVYPVGSLVKEADSADVYYYDGTNYRIFSDEVGFSANRFSFDNVLTVPSTITIVAGGEAIAGAIGDMTDTSSGAGGTAGAGTGLTVSLSSETMASANIPAGTDDNKGAGLVPFTSINFTAASDGDVTVEGLTVTRIGIGDDDEIGNVYIYNGATRLTNSRSVSSDDTTVFNLNFVVAAGTTETLTVRANTSGATAAGTHGFAIASANDVETDGASVSGSFPIEGNTMGLTGIDAAGITYKIDDGADLDNSLKVGEDEVELVEIKLTETNGEENALVDAITFTNKGSIDTSDLSNFYMTNSGDIVADDVSVDGDRITVTFDTPFLIEDGDSETFELVMDITAGTGETIQFEIDDAEDISVRGASYGYYALTAVNGTAGADDITSLETVESGDLTVTEADSNPTTQDVAVGQDDVTFLAAKFEANDETIVVTTLDVDITFTQSGTDNSSTEDYLANLSLYLDGDRVGGPEDVNISSSTHSTSVTFDDEFEITGSQVLTVVADITDDADNGKYEMIIDTDSNFEAEDLSGDDIIGTEITGKADGNLVKVGQDLPSISKDSTLGNKNIVAGQEDVEVARFILDAGDSEALEINKYTVSFDFSETENDFKIGDIEDLYINEENKVSSPSSEEDFSVNETIAAGAEKIISVYLTIDEDTNVAQDKTFTVKLSVDAEGDISGDDITEDGFADAADVGNNTVVVGQETTLKKGSLSLALSSGTPDKGLVLAGSKIDVAEFEFSAENTGYEITEITITARDGSATTSDPTATNISKMFIGEDSDSTNAGVAEISTSIRVEKDEETKVAVKAIFNDDFDAIDSGDEVYFHVTGYKYIADNDTSNEVEIINEDGDPYIDVITTEKLAVYNTIPTIISSAGDTTTLKTSDNEIMDISVTADARDDVTIKAFRVEIRLTDGSSGGGDLATSSVTLLDGSGDKIIDGGYIAASSTPEVSVYEFTPSTDNVITSGDTEVFTVNVNLKNVNVDDSCEVSLIETGFTWSDDEEDSIIENTDLIDDLDGSFEISK